MCELFAMNSSHPTDVGPYLTRLMPRGGKTGPHADGWGVAYYEGRAARIFKDPAPAAQSRLLATLARQRLRSTAVVAHIRKANPSIFGRSTANTHPFEREWNGRSWVFAHNGKLPGLHELDLCPRNRFRPLGDTDSELAFCLLLAAIADRSEREGVLSPPKLIDAIRPVVEVLSETGEFNFVLSDGEHVYVHAHTRLHTLQQASDSTCGMKTTVLATEPLSAGDWEPLAPGTMKIYRAGDTLM